MAYNAVAQEEQISSPGIPPSPTSDGIDLGPISTDNQEFDGGRSVEDNNASADAVTSRLGSLIQSLTSTRSSYDMVEDDDYDVGHVTPLEVKKRSIQQESTPTRDYFRSSSSHSSSPERTVPFRTASISRNTPLRHPVPDLQSLQGAYVKNVERLEESAERLSMTSSLEEELQKMKLDQRRLSRQSSAPTNRVGIHPPLIRQFSSGSATNSIIDLNNAARSGGYSPCGYITSPREPVFSGSWSQPSKDDRPTSKGSRLGTGTRPTAQPRKSTPLDFDSQQPDRERKATPLDFGVLASTPGSASIDFDHNAYHIDAPAGHNSASQSRDPSVEARVNDQPPRPASTETFRQANDLFTDFDGVHFATAAQTSLERQTSQSRQVPLVQPPLASDPTSFEEPQPGQRMVYYPAPVPMLLNLPQKLSKESAGQRERRRLQGISEISDKMMQAAPWLQEGVAKGDSERRRTKLLSGLPPQLRANAFFDQPAASQNVEVKDASAVATLDSILNASAHAPVSAFTDHPIAGPAGKDIYGSTKTRRKRASLESTGKKKRNSSFGNALHGRIASRESKAYEAEEEEAGGGNGETTPLRDSDGLARAARQSISPDDEELLDERDGADSELEREDDEDGESVEQFGAPNTLMAELQLRKTQQKQRNRTAATAFPNGMHATLLELDAIAQLQQKSRKQKHVKLAWEDHDQADRENFDDDDVPLAMLIPQSQNDVNRPIGLMEKRQIEDNEPLSHRRAKLRGEPIRPRGPTSVTRSYPNSLRTTDQRETQQNATDEPEGETLAQRLRRLKAQKESVADLTSDFANEISNELGLRAETAAGPSKTPDADETLGQRRKRLQQEGLANNRQVSSGSSNAAATSLRPGHSMLGTSTLRPAPSATGNFQGGAVLPYQNTTPQAHTQNATVPFTQTNNSVMQGIVPVQYPYNNTIPYLNNALNYQAPMTSNPTMVAQHYAVPSMLPYTPDPMMGPPLDPKQRIDSWRQSIVR